MIKYGTFQIWENIKTGELHEIPLHFLDKFSKTGWIRREDLEDLECCTLLPFASNYL